MSKLIVEMAMPQNCFECNFHCVGQFCDGMGYCSAVPPYCDDDCRPCEEKRPSWCPIKGVLPDEHGDLIDRDELKKSKVYSHERHEYIVPVAYIDWQNAAITAERKDDADYQASVLMQEYIERYEPTYNREDGSM